MTVYGYCRASTVEQCSDGDNVAAQQQQIIDYGLMRGWWVAKFFTDAGFGGSIPLAERPQGRQLLGIIANGDVIITARLDRAFGSAADALGTLEELGEAGVRLHMIDLGGDVWGNGTTKLLFTILSAVAENEREPIRQRVRNARGRRTPPATYTGGNRRFGYDIVDGRLLPNVTEQAATARVHTLRQEGRRLREISQSIADEFGVAIAPMTVKRILDRGTKL